MNPEHLELVSTEEHKQRHGKWNREKLLAAFHDCAEFYGRQPASTDWNPSLARSKGHAWRVENFYKNEWPAVSTVRLVFGSWNNFVAAAGGKPREPGYGDRHKEYHRLTK